MRWSAPLAVSAAVATLVATCARPGTVARTGREPDMRVALSVGASQVQVGGQSGVAAVAGGDPQFDLAAGEAVTVTADGRALEVSGARAGRYQALRFASLDRAQFVTVDGRPYRGVIEVLPSGGSVTAVNIVSLEAYVAGVINAEMGRRAEAERAALEAQAIVSRTYAVNRRGRHAAEGYDVTATISDQVYGGVEHETPLGWQAVRSTTGEIVTYGGEPIEAFFYSTCGFATASPDEAFRFGRPMPFLRSVSDRHGDGYYCEDAPRFRWTVEWDGEKLAGILRETVPGVLGIERQRLDVIKNVTVHRTGPSGRVVELRIEVGTGQIPVFGPDVRAVLRRPDGRLLGSTAFQLEGQRSDGRLRRLVARGAGWGHGVGFCQWGAVGRARAGQPARTIVTTYFPGTQIERWY
jgi:stage II sporulation protein D